MTLLINATTTAWVVNKLGLSRQSDIKKNILISISYQLEDSIQKHISHLKEKRHFNHVDWKLMMETIEMKDLRKNLKRYAHLHLEKTEAGRLGDSHIDTLANINEKNENRRRSSAFYAE